MVQKSKSHSLQQRKRTTGGRNPSLGYYLIVTDGKKTEKNYFDGLKKHIPDALRNRLAIVVHPVKNTKDLIDYARKEILKSPQKREIWIVLDRDDVPEFDQFVAEAEGHGFKVGWSHPCIELWFHAYLGEMPQSTTSHGCIETFKRTFQQATKRAYEKKDKAIYQRLREHGDEEQAIKCAKQRMREYKSQSPSKCHGVTMVYQLVGEISERIKGKE